VQLRITPDKGLEIIVPKGFDHHCIPEILDAKRQWIANHLERFNQWHQQTEDILPHAIHLQAIDQHWKVVHVPGGESACTLQATREHELSLMGPRNHVPSMAMLLQKWLVMQGKIHLPPWLEKVRQTNGLPRFSRIQVRNQKTRWGSCSAKGTISLNAKLLFIDPQLVEYILIHELCHLIHLDHSPQFWKTVETHMADFRTREAHLQQAWIQVPAWAGM
jgi:predicted metal-dependent hydrolase